MTKEELKGKLREYRGLSAERRHIEQQLEQLRKESVSLRSPNMDGMPRSSGGSDPIFGAVERSMKLEEKYQKQLNRIDADQAEIEDMIELLDSPTERELMRHYYIEGETWENVCVIMNYSWRHIHRFHSNALTHLMEKMA